MLISPEWLLIYAALGLCVGFLAGLLGIGGGAIMVPVLTSIFAVQGVATENVVHLALGSAMAAIVATSIASASAHHRRGAVMWPVVMRFAPGVLLGTFGATFIVARTNANILATFFAVFIFFIALQLMLNRQPKPSRSLPNAFGLATVGAIIGGISALVSIGGGSLTVPFLSWVNVPLKRAIATSAAVGVPISVAGTFGYAINGLSADFAIPYATGYVVWPAVLAISACSIFAAPQGAKLAHRLPVAILKRILAVLMMLLAARMLMIVYS